PALILIFILSLHDALPIFRARGVVGLVGGVGLVLGGCGVVLGLRALGLRVLGVRVLGVRVLRVGVVGRLRRGVLRGAGDLGAATVTGGRRLLVLRGAAGGEGEDESGDGG